MAPRSRYGVLLAVVLVFGALAAWSLPKLTLQNQLTAFFPPAETADQSVLFDSLKQSLNQDRSQQPLMVSVQLPLSESVSSNDAAAISQTLASALRDQSWVAGVRNAPSPVSAWNQAPLREYRYLLTDFDLETLPSRLDDLWQAWQMGLVLDKATALSDPTQQWFRYLGQSRFQQAVPSVAGVWGETTPSSDEQPESIQLLFLVTFKPAALASYLQAVEPVLRAALVKSGVPEMDRAGVKIVVSNVAWIAQQARHDIEQDVKWLSVIATLLVLGFLFWTFRRPLWVFLSFVPLATGTLLGTLAVQTVFGSIEAMTLALGVVLIGVAVDYPIHALAALRQSPQQAWRNWPVIRLGALSSLVGLGSLMWLGIPGVLQMGLFAAVGLLTALGMTRFMLWVLSPVTSIPTAVKMADTDPALATVRDGWKWMGLTALVLAVLWWKPIVWQDDLASLSPVPPSLLQQDADLRQAFRQPEASQFLLVPADSMQTLLQRQEALTASLAQLKTDGVIQGWLGLSDWLPSVQRQAQRLSALPSADALNSALAQSDTPLQSKHFQSFVQGLEASLTLSLLDWPRFETLALDWQQALLPTLVTETANGVVGKILLQGVTRPASLADWSEAQGVLYFNQRSLVAESVTQLRWELAWGLFGLLWVFVLGLRLATASFAQAWRILLPVVFGLGLSLASLSVFGQAVTVFHLLAGFLVVAIGLDYSLFARQARQQAQASQETPQQDDPMSSVTIALMTTILTFGCLLWTSIPILVAIGQTLVVGVIWVYLLARWQNRV
jgi:predicted exporter